MHRLPVPVGQPVERGDRSPGLCLPLPVQWTQNSVSTYIYLDMFSRPQQLCFVCSSPLRTGTRWPLTPCGPTPLGTKEVLGKACPITVFLGPGLKLPLFARPGAGPGVRVM